MVNSPELNVPGLPRGHSHREFEYPGFSVEILDLRHIPRGMVLNQARYLALSGQTRANATTLVIAI
jgi:hypothetical protein